MRKKTRVCWASPFACAPGRALVNQAPTPMALAVLAIRQRSLTHPATRGFISGARLPANYSATRHIFAPFISAMAEVKRADHGPVTPTAAGSDTSRALNSDGFAGLRRL